MRDQVVGGERSMARVLYAAYILERSQRAREFTVVTFARHDDLVDLVTAGDVRIQVADHADAGDLRHGFERAGIALEPGVSAASLVELSEATPWERWLELQLDLSQSESYLRDFGCEYRSISVSGLSAVVEVARGTSVATASLDLSQGPLTRGVGLELVDHILD